MAQLATPFLEYKILKCFIHQENAKLWNLKDLNWVLTDFYSGDSTICKLQIADAVISDSNSKAVPIIAQPLDIELSSKETSILVDHPS